jgi:UDP-2,4-diacetamido-2,4,6-trideoxy-beta-L-altropyranose hydrolase
MGMGHIMRCLSLAQAWKTHGGGCVFALAGEEAGPEAKLQAAGFAVARLHHPPGGVADAAATVALAQTHRASWVVVDGYHFDAAFQQALKEAGLGLLFIDDYGHAGRYVSDLVLNQNLYAEEAPYRDRAPYTRLLLGTRFVLLRQEFWPWRTWRRNHSQKARKVLVTLGGSDPNNVTAKVVQALKQAPGDLEAVIVTGIRNHYYEDLAVQAKGSASLRLQENATNMPELMAWADVAISAGGTTCWELAFMELPCLVVVAAENQRRNAEELAKAGMALNLGWHTGLDGDHLARTLLEVLRSQDFRVGMVQRGGRQLVDGEGVWRVLACLKAPETCFG